ncbi:Replication protein RepB [Limosilactobacillus reuteri]|uniref:Replication protein RepB n=2 Tax=Limosilactobacillus reuteri TaxID=1598 RepID=A0A1Y2UEM8_LIMRT|nr:replication protein [Limosilactobacillus reuteri]NME21935.1 Replication protein RepB [Limosilactobacillus reuteri]OTA81011.1 Replication protein RepB [Limosilactobacillus reuteri]
MTKNIRNQRASKWTFLIYKESAPNNYLQILDEIHVPFMLSPWHDKDIDLKTGKVKKAHKHGVLYFERLKSYSQVVALLEPLNGPEYIEIVHSTVGMYDYFTHAETPSKEPYNVDDIQYGCGFDLSEFLASQNQTGQINEILTIIDNKDIREFNDLVRVIREDDTNLLKLLASKSYFFSKYIDSVRYGRLDREG